MYKYSFKKSFLNTQLFNVLQFCKEFQYSAELCETIEYGFMYLLDFSIYYHMISG